MYIHITVLSPCTYVSSFISLSMSLSLSLSLSLLGVYVYCVPRDDGAAVVAAEGARHDPAGVLVEDPQLLAKATLVHI